MLSNQGRKGIRETQQHLLNIELWYQRWWAQRAAQLDRCKSAIERLSAESNSQFELFLAFRPSGGDGQRPVPLPPEFTTDLLNRASQTEAEAVRSCASQ